MRKISSIRLTVPKAAGGEIARDSLVDRILEGKTGFTYIHAGAGYGKTTLLSQLARRFSHVAPPCPSP